MNDTNIKNTEYVEIIKKLERGLLNDNQQAQLVERLTLTNNLDEAESKRLARKIAKNEIETIRLIESLRR
jgi:hypothetical protein